ncbi:MAG TPA: SOS response-associated peptidase [Actinocrinis sp.]|uniref:SOS response-associated peptidase n=1 Tax=Actinocrinis sp. TaxID=1920516 RepID=UPI002DDDB5D4|nr:SOS response-associated peptidase [Actinocrinis sp.]HEV2343792.1 SOS response-associated peptidase [Actinocrinis sp.]
MCGRYVVTTPPQQLALDFDAVLDIEQAPVDYPDYNVAPTKPVPAVLVRGDQRVLSTLRWGLIPFWAKDPSVGAKMINARIESAAEKSAFKQSFARRRCLLPADGYYEWLTLLPEPGAAASGGKGKPKPRKQPYYIRPAEGGPLAFAGLYERWRDAEGRELWSTTILTTAAAESMTWLHDRMPLTVPSGGWDAWLDPALDDPQRARALLDFAPRWATVPVSEQVNSVRNNGPELIEPVASDPSYAGIAERDTLF